MAPWILTLGCLLLQAPGQEAALVALDEHREQHPAAGRRMYTIASTVLGQTRQLFVALPESYGTSAPARRYPTIVVLDGEGRSALAVLAAYRELATHGLAPEAIVVGVENTDSVRGRLRDLTPPGVSVSGSSLTEGGDRFLDFLERELLPAVDRQLRGGEPRVLVGHSSGGILATYAAATRTAFRMVVALDLPATVGDGWLRDQFIGAAQKSTVPLRYASYGARYGWPAEEWKRIVAAAPTSWKLHYEYLPLETHASVPMIGAYLGLREVFGDYSRRAAPEFPTTTILPYYDRLTELYGAAQEPPAPLLRQLIDDLLMEGRGAAARAALARYVFAYGEPPHSAALRAEIAEVERRPAPAETVEELLATPHPTPEAAAPFVGEYVGEEWAEGAGRQPRRLSIRVENGRVRAYRTTVRGGIEQTAELPYLAVGDNEFTFGFMNGMRPYALLLYTMRRSGDIFEGEQRWGGVALANDPNAPRFFVRLTKKQ